MIKTTFTVAGHTFTNVSGLTGRILGLTLNHTTSILTVAYANEAEMVNPADDWAWWDHLVAKYMC